MSGQDYLALSCSPLLSRTTVKRQEPLVPPAEAVLLGESGDTTYWAMRGEWEERVAGASGQGELWRDLRGCGAELGDTDAGLLTTAVAVLNWHDRAQFCAICGSPTARRSAGWGRYCLRCGHEEYPRTDPSMICLVHDAEDSHVLLARQPGWPQGRFSVLAAVADRDAPVHPADGEIAHVRWVSREELRAALAEGGWTHREDGSGNPAALLLPGEVSIARRMLDVWCAARP
ncbi:MAG: hypothetical protein GEU83_19975 [Pseudonocardiaceae bacterium]|nr:hypothetical protein [Pseudonocardiaceae bacterium]